MRFRLFSVLLFVAFTASQSFAAIAIKQTITPPPTIPRRTFSIPSLSSLKTAFQDRQPIQLVTASTGGFVLPVTGTTTPVLMTDPYSSAQGVVLDVCHPKHAQTTSILSIYNANWDESTRNRIAANDPQADLSVTLSWNSLYANWIGQGYFQCLPTGQHTYVMTVGTSAPVDKFQLQLAYEAGVMQPLTVPQLVGNTATSEIRVMFTLNIPESATADKRYLAYWLSLQPMETMFGVAEVRFHHIQLLRLD